MNSSFSVYGKGEGIVKKRICSRFCSIYVTNRRDSDLTSTSGARNGSCRK